MLSLPGEGGICKSPERVAATGCVTTFDRSSLHFQTMGFISLAGLSDPCVGNFRNYTPVGDLWYHQGGGIAVDSAWRLQLLSLSCGTGDPGCLITKTKKEPSRFESQKELYSPASASRIL
jgi:hypothetical protein